MRVAIQCGLLFVAWLSVSRPVEAEPTNDRWEAALAHAQWLIQARTNEVRELRKDTDALVESLNKVARYNGAKVPPDFKRDVALKRLYYYTRLGTLNAVAVEMEQTLPKKVAPVARQKVLDMLARLRDELRATVVALNHVARTLNDL